MANKEIDELSSMEGERGIPSANETGGVSRSQKLPSYDFGITVLQ